jgi:4-cresol dehydrogenase (hydroxylating)
MDVSSNSAGAGGGLREALRAWAELLGAEYVRADDAARDRYGRSTAPSGTRPLAVLCPESTAEVQELVRIAGRFGIPLYPISKGKNWGYGDACAPTDGQVIVDLGRMNRILEVNTRLAYAVIEPGVTQGQLCDYLRGHKTGLWVDSTGAGRDASLVGNTLDRGFGHTRYGDHFLTTCGMEIVLADGRVLNTGFGHYANAKAARAYRYGVGPFLDGLFAQSNFGIITRIGLWLMPEPEAFCSFYFSAPNDDDLSEVVDRLASLRMQGLLQSAIHIGNDLRLLSARARYPWQRAGGRTPLPRELRAELRREHGIGAWNAGSAIYGTRATVAATRKAVRRALARFRPRFITDRTLALAERVLRVMNRFGMGRKLGEMLQIGKPVYELLKGIPTDEPLRGTGWRVRDPDPGKPMDPLDCHAGLMWVSPVVPATGEAATELMRIVEPIYEKHGFEALVTFTMITERAMCCVTNLAFDKREADETARAAACYEELVTTLIDAGYIPYRTGPSGFAKLTRNSSVFWDVARQLKQTLDPQGIISPGRYIPFGDQ